MASLNNKVYMIYVCVLFYDFQSYDRKLWDITTQNNNKKDTKKHKKERPTSTKNAKQMESNKKNQISNEKK